MATDQIPTEILERKGPRKAADIDPQVLDWLNQGCLEAVNLTEWLVIDHPTLITQTFPALGLPTAWVEELAASLKAQPKLSTMNSIKLVGAELYAYSQTAANLEDLLATLSAQQSDSLRSYAPYLIALHQPWSLEEKLVQARHLVADSHFGVREVIWMALRPVLAEDLETAVALLLPWTKEEDPNIRRFTTEVLRPRGVWCKHIDQLKEQPELASPILEALKADPAKYVQDSLGNWLNDASKTRPDFVLALCERWEKDGTKATLRIIKKAKRTLNKK